MVQIIGAYFARRGNIGTDETFTGLCDLELVNVPSVTIFSGLNFLDEDQRDMNEFGFLTDRELKT